MKDIFEHGRELIDIIQESGWLLFDLRIPTEEGRKFEWEEMEDIATASQLEIGSNYLFVPKPLENQTLRDAYSLTKGLGPSLEIHDPKNPKWLSFQICEKKIPGYIALFSRLFLEKEYIVASSPVTQYIMEPDAVIMPYENVVSIFREHYRIIKPEEIREQTPIWGPAILN